MSHPVTLTAAILLLAIVGLPAAAVADDAASFRTRVAAASAELNYEFRELLQTEMRLDSETSEKFWDVFDRYSEERQSIQDRYTGLIGGFVDKYYRGAMTDDDANDLLDNYLDNRIELLKLRQKYLKRFRKAMTGRQVARFYQLENKVQAQVDAALAVAIPLVDIN